MDGVSHRSVSIRQSSSARRRRKFRVLSRSDVYCLLFKKLQKTSNSKKWWLENNNSSARQWLSGDTLVGVVSNVFSVYCPVLTDRVLTSSHYPTFQIFFLNNSYPSTEFSLLLKVYPLGVLFGSDNESPAICLVREVHHRGANRRLHFLARQAR